jgi:hypothetical protein
MTFLNFARSYRQSYVTGAPSGDGSSSGSKIGIQNLRISSPIGVPGRSWSRIHFLAR